MMTVAEENLKKKNLKKKRLNLKGKILLAAFLVLTFGAGPVLADMTKQQLQEMYAQYLKEEGYSSKIDSDGDIAFKFEGKNYYILIDEDDLEHFMVVYPNFWEIESKKEREAALLAAAESTNSTKVSKVVVGKDNVSVRAGIFLPNPSDFKSVFKRMLSSIGTAREKFIKEMRKDD